MWSTPSLPPMAPVATAASASTPATAAARRDTMSRLRWTRMQAPSGDRGVRMQVNRPLTAAHNPQNWGELSGSQPCHTFVKVGEILDNMGRRMRDYLEAI